MMGKKMKELVKYPNDYFKAIITTPINEELLEEINKELCNWRTLEGKEIKIQRLRRYDKI